MITINNIEQGSEAWFRLRTGRITGTGFSKLMAGKGTAAYQNLITDLAVETITEAPVEEDFKGTYATNRGKEVEPEARFYLSQVLGIEIEEVGFILTENEKYNEWLGISPDGIIRPQKAGVEIKCPLSKAHLNYLTKGVLPSTYKWQVYGSLYTSGLDFWYFMSYFPRLKPFIIKVYPDYKIFNEIETRLDETIPLVEAKIKSYNEYTNSE